MKRVLALDTCPRCRGLHCLQPLRDALLSIANHTGIDWIKVTATDAIRKADLK